MLNLHFAFWHIDNNANMRNIAILDMRFSVSDRNMCKIYRNTYVLITVKNLLSSVSASRRRALKITISTSRKQPFKEI